MAVGYVWWGTIFYFLMSAPGAPVPGEGRVHAFDLIGPAVFLTTAESLALEIAGWTSAALCAAGVLRSALAR